MFKFSKLSTYFLISCLSITPAAANISSLPDMGTAAASTLTIDKEIEYGDAYMRMMRASQPIIADPLLNEYLTNLGSKLVANASDVRTPFKFFLIQNSDINAFAFFGGHIGVHSGLFLHANTESELASVLAHEIAHVTQRHLARSMEEQAKRSPATMAAMIGSLMLAIAAPEAGIAALHATTAASMQGQINYTRSNEREADRIGMSTLAKSGFDPQAMPRFFGRMAEQYRYASKPPAMLLTHPLPEERLTESRERAAQFGRVNDPDGTRYYHARSRIVARHAGIEGDAALDWFERQLRRNKAERKNALHYGQALVHIDNNRYDKAKSLLDPLLKAEPYNRYYIDAATDLDVKQQHYDEALARLETALTRSPGNAVLRINQVYVLHEAGRYEESVPLLSRYTFDYPTDLNGWAMLNEAYAKTGDRAGELATRAEQFALRGRWDQAISDYIQASRIVETGSMQQSIYDARIDQLRIARQRFEAL
ncbi:M48 family metalloprotease [Thaumasiovibrio subtropicus]|uniref:beta-barrel assembly-enhancing protease n=1 Tax=Thaumasiovibrio subtropicus TaxID=1891207 RepID=UPI000B357120|nr:M48 family metalloprotease [Thaumasiovibrio subtropicus]